jgi:hypothetical protein
MFALQYSTSKEKNLGLIIYFNFNQNFNLKFLIFNLILINTSPNKRTVQLNNLYTCIIYPKVDVYGQNVQY